MRNLLSIVGKITMCAMACLIVLSFTTGQGMAQFYKGKTVTVLIGYSAGGGMDRMARVLTETLSDFLPGNPTVIIKTMPGAGGNKALNFLYTKGSKDGTLLWFGPVNFLDQAIGSEGVRFDYAKFELICAMRVPPNVMYARTDIVDGGLKSPEDILKAKDLKLAGRNPKSDIDLQARTSLDLLGVPFTYVTGYKGGAKTRLAVQSGEMNIEATGIPIYRTAIATMIEEGKAKGLWYFPYLDSDNQVVKSDAIKDLPDFVEVYRKLKGKDPEGPTWEVLKLVLEYRSLASNMFMMPPGTEKEAVDVMRKGVAEMMKTEELEKRQMKILNFTADIVPLEAAENKIKGLSSLDQERLENYKSYIAAGSKK